MDYQQLSIIHNPFSRTIVRIITQMMFGYFCRLVIMKSCFFFHHPQSQVKIHPVIVVVCFRNPELALNLNMKGMEVIWGVKLS